MRFDLHTPVRIVMLGAGGTGGHAAPQIYRLLHTLTRQVRFLIADADIVEQRNLIRQNFIMSDLGQNKARVLAERYASAFGLETEYLPFFVEDAPTLQALLETENDRQLTILIGAVDNDRTRRLCHQVFYTADTLVYLDAGNGEFSGQVVCGVRRNGRTRFKPLAGFYPDVLRETDAFPSERSCAAAAAAAPQAITANLMAATALVDILYNILILGRLRVRMVTFSTETATMRPLLAARRSKCRH